jgi:hypothetical protein
MHPAIQTLRNALGYAKFKNDEIRDSTLNLVTTIGHELQTEEYEPGAAVESAQNQLEDALNNADNASEAVDIAIENAVAGAIDTDEAETTA